MRHLPRFTSTGQPVYCGPAAIAHATGIGVDTVVEVANRICGRKVRVMYIGELQSTLDALGFKATRCRLYPHRLVWTVHKPAILLTGRHYVYVDGLMVGDQHQVRLSAEHWSRVKRAKYAWTIERKAA